MAQRIIARGATSLGAVATAGLLTLALGACGGSGRSSGGSVNTSTTAAAGSPAAVTTGPVRAQLIGQTHDPVVDRNWTYAVTATDRHGHPLSGTAETEFALRGTVVGRETPSTHPLRHGQLP